MCSNFVPPNADFRQNAPQILIRVSGIAVISKPTNQLNKVTGCYRIPIEGTGDKVLRYPLKAGIIAKRMNYLVFSVQPFPSFGLYLLNLIIEVTKAYRKAFQALKFIAMLRRLFILEFEVVNMVKDHVPTSVSRAILPHYSASIWKSSTLVTSPSRSEPPQNPVPTATSPV